MTKKQIKLAILNGKENEIREQLIIDLIRQKYSLNQELAIIRQRNTKENEFNEYNIYVEECKAAAKTLINEVKSVWLP